MPRPIRVKEGVYQNSVILFGSVLLLLLSALGCSSVEKGGDLPPGSCTSDADCEDDNPCTRRICLVDGRCESILQPGTACDDGDACTEGDVCDASGACLAGPSLLVDIASCQACTCDPVEGLNCEVLEAGTVCDDGDCCTLDDTCAACDPETDEGCGAHGMTCEGAPKACFDDDPCTDDACACTEEDDPYCQNPPAEEGTVCDYDEADCTVGDSCLGGQCILSEPLPLDDGNPCTVDTCVKGVLAHGKLLEGQCDDGDECTNDDHCYLGNCVGGDLVVCVKPPCASSASCVNGAGCTVQWQPAGAECQDGNSCTLNDHCDGSHNCTATAYQNCDDGDPCTKDVCVPSVGCTNQPSLDPNCVGISPCEDANACNDGNPCTADICAIDTGECSHQITESKTCMVLTNGNNLISFSIIPPGGDLVETLGPLEPYVLHLFSEARFAKRMLTGEWRGNLKTIEPHRGYWIYLNLPPGQSPFALHLTGSVTDPDIRYRLHTGVNIVSFAGPVTDTDVAIGAANFPLIEGVIGQGIAAFPKEGKWIGSLTKLRPNKGYEIVISAPIDPFQFACSSCDGNDGYVTGCTHWAATNFDAQAVVDDGGCAFAVPEEWNTPAWGGSKDQAFLMARDLGVNGVPLETGDAVAAFIDGVCAGVGFVEGNEVTVPAINGLKGQPVAFQIYDVSVGAVSELTFSTPISWSLNAIHMAGCMEPTAGNYDAFADVQPAEVVCQ